MAEDRPATRWDPDPLYVEEEPRATMDMDLNARKRPPFPGEGYLWAAWHRVRGHRVERWGWSIGWGGHRRSWYCLGAGLGCGKSWPS